MEDEEYVAHDRTQFWLSTQVKHFEGPLDHTRPHAEVLPYFYEVICRHERKLREAFPDEDLRGWNVKSLYRELQAQVTAERPRRCGQEDAHIVAPGVPGQPDRRSLAALTCRASVRTRLMRMGLSRTDRCPECVWLEHHKHISYNCLKAPAMWRKVAGL